MRNLLCYWTSRSSAAGVALGLLGGATLEAGVIYGEPPGGWTYIYTGDSATGLPHSIMAPALDGTWMHNNDSDEWNGDGRGAGTPPVGGVESANGILTMEDATNLTSGVNNNRKFYFTRDLRRDAVTANDLLDAGVTLTFRTRLTPPDGRQEITLPNGYGLFSNGKGMFGVHQVNGDALISFSLVRATEDATPTTTLNFSSAGLTMNRLNGDMPTGAVISASVASQNQVLALDPTDWHEFWMTIRANDATPGNGTHRIDFYVDGATTPTTFNVTAGTGAGVWTGSNYITMGLNNSATIGAFDVDFFAYKPGIHVPVGTANNDFADRIAINSSTRRVTGQNGGADREFEQTFPFGSEPDHAGNDGGASVWWSWTAPFSGPVTFTTAGSSFSPLLAIYTGNSPFQLSSIASNYTFGGASRVVFGAAAGTTYQIALDGFFGQEGSIVLSWDYLPVPTLTGPPGVTGVMLQTNLSFNLAATDRDGTVANLAFYDNERKLAETSGTSLAFPWTPAGLGGHVLRAVATDNDGFSSTSAPVRIVVSLGITGITGLNATANFDDTVAFTAHTVLGNFGTAVAGPLRVRLVARAGYSYDPTASPPTSLPADVALGIFNLPSPGNVNPGQSASVNINGVAPAPSGDSTRGFGWGVFAILESNVGGRWLAQDNQLVLFGVWPIVGDNQGPGGGVIRIDPRASGGGFTPVSLTQVAINGPASVTEGATVPYFGTASFDDQTIQNFTNTAWTASGSSTITTNGQFTAGNVTSDTSTTLTCYYAYGAHTNSTTKLVNLINLPPPRLTGPRRTGNGSFQFNLEGVARRRHAIDASTNLSLPPPNRWTALSSNLTDPAGLWLFNDANVPSRPRRFYRARELE